MDEKKFYSDYFTSAAIEAGTYRVVVTDVSASSSSPRLLLTFRVLDDPRKGETFYSHLYIARPGEPAAPFFLSKIAGFVASDKAVEAYENAEIPDDELLARFSESLLGQTAFVKVRVQGSEGGAYEGRNDIVASFPAPESDPVEELRDAYSSLIVEVAQLRSEIRELRRGKEE